MSNFSKQGDLIWIDAEPHAGHEYGGHDPENDNNRRPALVISSDVYNARTGMVSVFPITSHVPSGFWAKIKVNVNDIDGYIITSQILGYDYIARNGKIVGPVSNSVKREALTYVRSIYGFLE